MHKFLLFIIFFVALAGCARNLPIGAEQQKSLYEKDFAISSREKPGFSAMTVGKAMFGALGVAPMIIEGNRIVSEYGIEDPSVYVARKIAEDLISKNKMTLMKESPFLSGNEIPDLLKENIQSQYLLDVQTLMWGFSYYAGGWNKYRVNYSLRLRLINIKTKEVIAEGFCARLPNNKKMDNLPDYDQLIGNSAARLKKELIIHADSCIEELKTKVLF